MRILLACSFLGASVAGSAYWLTGGLGAPPAPVSESAPPARPFEAEYEAIRTYAVAHVPDISLALMAQDRTALVRAIGYHIHRDIPRPWQTEGDPEWATWQGWKDVPLVSKYLYAVTGQDGGHSCGGKSYLFETVLAAFGIPSRHVDYFSDVDEVVYAEVGAHSTTEVWLDGGWVAVDPLFNFIARDPATGSYIDHQTLYARLGEGAPVRLDPLGPRQAAKRDLLAALAYAEEHGDGRTTAERMRYIRVYADPLHAMERTGEFPVVYTGGPTAWDGILRYAAGKETE